MGHEMTTGTKKDITELLDSNSIEELKDYSRLSSGAVIRRISSAKDQQGRFNGFDDKGGLILINVIDMSSSDFTAEAGIVRPSKDDTIYCYTSSFSKNKKSSEAMEILSTWPLYKKNPELRIPMETFFRSTFSPEHILYLKKNDMLDSVFIPLQQKLKIGRYVEVINWDNIRKEKFHEHLKALKPGEHITYIALVPQTTSYAPKFYSIGTKPHEITHYSLRSEGFNFKPTHGGHIKADKNEKGIIYYVDAGSNFIGKGIKTKLETAESITKALKREYKDYIFIPLEGRGAFGTEQSY
jgi:hypothetical protein